MKKLVIVAFLMLIAANAMAEVLVEEFPDPLGGWRDRWLAQNSTMTNYYVCSGNPDENYRGNNECALWICDTDGDFSTADIVFNDAFGATVTHFGFGLVPFVDENLTVYNVAGQVIFTLAIPANGYFPPCSPVNVEFDTPGGLGRFVLGPSAVEGNTSIDNVTATVGGGPVPVETVTWGHIKSLYH